MAKGEEKVLYDGRNHCSDDCCCPLLTQKEDGTVVLNDPAKPEAGEFTFKDAKEFNSFLENAQTAE